MAFPCPISVGAIIEGKGGDLISFLVEVLVEANIILGGGGGALILSDDPILLSMP